MPKHETMTGLPSDVEAVLAAFGVTGFSYRAFSPRPVAPAGGRGNAGGSDRRRERADIRRPDAAGRRAPPDP